MGYTERFIERWEIVDYYKGDAVAAAAEVNTGYNVVANYTRLVVMILPVDVNDALDVDIEQGISTAGTSAKALDSNAKDITVATTDTLPSIIEIRPEEFDIAGGFNAINVEVTAANTGGSGNEFAVLILGLVAYAPAATTNVDSITD